MEIPADLGLRGGSNLELLWFMRPRNRRFKADQRLLTEGGRTPTKCMGRFFLRAPRVFLALCSFSSSSISSSFPLLFVSSTPYPLLQSHGLILYGQSVGSGPTCYLASEEGKGPFAGEACPDETVRCRYRCRCRCSCRCLCWEWLVSESIPPQRCSVGSLVGRKAGVCGGGLWGFAWMSGGMRSGVYRRESIPHKLPCGCVRHVVSEVLRVVKIQLRYLFCSVPVPEI